MADRLEIYRGALRLLGNQQIASLTEDHPARLALDEAWRPVGDFLLEKGLWNFALRSVELHNDEDVEALFGRQYAMSKPEDWVRTASTSPDGPFWQSGDDYDDQGGYWYTDSDPFYVLYVSNDERYGWNVGAWRQHFAFAMSAYLAFECGLPISDDKGNRDDLHGLAKSRLLDAKTKDAVDERVQRRPGSSLAQSRGTYRGYRSSLGRIR